MIPAQQDCRVKSDKLSGSYEGKCTNGLADGKGLAIGVDKYRGKFRDGYPHGKGTYTYADGSVYKGEFVMGRREGRGVYEQIVDGKKHIKDGYWKDDTFIGAKKEKPYVVRMRRNLDRYTINRVGEGDLIRIFLKQNGRNNTSVRDLMTFASSGNEMNLANNLSFKDVEFPFTCKLRYTTMNKIQTQTVEVVFEFEIKEPGTWNVEIHN
jgi:hypothetical protein